MIPIPGLDFAIHIKGHAPIRTTMRWPEIKAPSRLDMREALETEFELTVVERPARTPVEAKTADQRLALKNLMNVVGAIALSRGDEFTLLRAARIYQRVSVDEVLDGFGRRS